MLSLFAFIIIILFFTKVWVGRIFELVLWQAAFAIFVESAFYRLLPYADSSLGSGLCDTSVCSYVTNILC
jgi:hypothetical protein